ncbi:ASCH domain-containing protein [Klebsiella quasipneumoniae]|uniref:hypothetical protein n=1 Tax=Klebsiella quasipneumoniae TaxID=1463165 RepID=UPI00292C294B|nr:hypothetical protein [Klebsiella quasipneumoniae]MDV0811065.1 hypothetical protein [Klebsiella quasipneumoniae subsp. quasipneumoniae]
MKERGMIFNAEMVRALLDGRKTQTRRIIKDCTVGRDPISKFIKIGKKFIGCYPEDVPELIRECCPYGVPGDRIWVRETWAEAGASAPDLKLYRANYPEHVPSIYENVPPTEEIRWTPSIHMPRTASRILLEITGVRVERLNAISEEDAQAEGVGTAVWFAAKGIPESEWKSLGEHGAMQASYINRFATLWESIYGEESWKANPWVWVIEFKRVEGGEA